MLRRHESNAHDSGYEPLLETNILPAIKFTLETAPCQELFLKAPTPRIERSYLSLQPSAIQPCLPSRGYDPVNTAHPITNFAFVNRKNQLSCKFSPTIAHLAIFSIASGATSTKTIGLKTQSPAFRAGPINPI